jgi:hypothetical protein
VKAEALLLGEKFELRVSLYRNFHEQVGRDVRARLHERTPVSSYPPKQRYIAALFPVFFEILKWLWLLRFPIAPWIEWIDPARPPYRFLTMPVAASIGYWVIHIIIPAVALLGALSFFNRRFHAWVPEEVTVPRMT